VNDTGTKKGNTQNSKQEHSHPCFCVGLNSEVTGTNNEKNNNRRNAFSLKKSQETQ
jgi:hypothetical protein